MELFETPKTPLEKATEKEYQANKARAQAKASERRMASYIGIVFAQMAGSFADRRDRRLMQREQRRLQIQQKLSTMLWGRFN